MGAKVAVHRYTFPEHRSARVVVDLSCGGLAIEHGRTVPLRAQVESMGHGRAQGTVVMEGVPLSVYLEVDSPGWRQMLWYDRRLDRRAAPGWTSTASGRPRCGPSACSSWARPEPGRPIEVRLGFSLRGVRPGAARTSTRECGDGRSRRSTSSGRGPTAALARPPRPRPGRGGTPARRTVFATALYHSLIKPCFADDESPFWPTSGPFVFDVCTMWDIYKTQLPLLTAIVPDAAVDWSTP